MDVSVVHPEDLSSADLSTWRHLQASEPALDNAFLSPEFAAIVGRCRPQTRVAIVHDGGEIVAFLPFELGALGIGRAIGCGVSDAQGLICQRGQTMDPVRLVRACGIGVWEFDHLVFRLDVLSPWTYDVGQGPVMDVREGYEAYLHQDDRHKSRSMCSLLQKRRKLKREQGDIEFTFASTDMAALATLIDWKSAQYARTGHFDRFSRPWIRDLVRLLAACDEPACRGTLSTLSVGGRLIAAHFGIRTTTRLSLWFPSYDLEFARYSPGLQLFLALAEAAPDHGVGILDLGKGTEPYKLSLASWSYPVASGRVEAKQLASFARRLETGVQRRADDFIVGHPRLRALLPPGLSKVGRLR
jgi:CelD/BcsL family acetyltransferase involved in cellulose biosynthesis